MPTMPLMRGLFEHDELYIRLANESTKPIIAMYYSNGMHNRICYLEYCYAIGEKKLTCICKYCENEITDTNHILECNATDERRTIKRLKMFINGEITPKLEMCCTKTMHYNLKLQCNENAEEL